MAQKRFLEYLSDDDTFSLNIKNCGIFPSGCYRGFDTAEIVVMPVEPNKIAVRFKHEETGFSYTDKDLVSHSNTALLITDQGVKIWETAAVNVQVTEVLSGQRIDAIVMNHSYTVINGGTFATISTLEGTSTEKPTIPDGVMLIGYLVVRPTSVVWQKKEVRYFGGYNLAEHENLFTAKQRAEILPIGVLNGVLNVSEGNLFEVVGTTINFLTSSKDIITNESKNGARVVIFALTDLVFSDILELQDQGYTISPDGQKWVNTNTGKSLTLKAGGSIELIETENFYEVVNVYDNLKNVVKLSNDLNNKGLWWLMPPFVSAIKQVVSQNNIASSINSDLFQVESGVIKCGALANLKNIVNVNVPVGEDLISEIETAYPIGSHVTVFFKATTESILECGGANINGFRSNKWNRFVVKNGSIARFLQQDDGLWLLDGLDISEQWVTPVVPSQVSTISENGALKYKICNDGTIKFEGSVSMAANSAAAVLFTLPRSLFKFPDWTVQKRIFVPSFYGSANGNYTNNNMVYFIDGANVKFQIATDNVSTDFNFQSVIINFR